MKAGQLQRCSAAEAGSSATEVFSCEGGCSAVKVI